MDFGLDVRFDFVPFEDEDADADLSFPRARRSGSGLLERDEEDSDKLDRESERRILDAFVFVLVFVVFERNNSSSLGDLVLSSEDGVD